jgi:hemerythrin-like domain-containing protein
MVLADAPASPKEGHLMNPKKADDQAPMTQPAPSSSARSSGSAETERRPGSAPRVRTGSIDMYRAPHKALRFLLANLLLKMGSTSFGEESSARSVIADLEVALSACDEHIAHEDTFVRPALVGRAPNATATLDHEHAEHAQQVAELRALAAALTGAATSDARRALGDTLYLHFSVFVAETLAHAAYEERVIQPLLDRLFSAEELQAIHEELVASIAPAAMMAFLQAMIPGSNREERAETLGKVKLKAPPAVFAGLLNELRPRLSSDDWEDLRQRVLP